MNIRVSLRLTILLLFFAGFFWLLHRQDLSVLPLLWEKPPYTLALIFVLLLGWIAGAGRTKAYCRLFNISLSREEAFSLSTASSLLNYFPLQGGVLGRGAYLSKRYKLGVPRFLAMTLASYLVICIVFPLGGLLGLLFMPSLPDSAFGTLAAMFALPPIIGLICFSPFSPTFLNRLPPVGRELFELLLKMRRQPRILTEIIAWELLQFGSEVIRIYLSFQLLSLQIPVSLATAIAGAAIPSVLLSITPSGLGIREGFIAAIAAAGGYSLAPSLAAAGLDRLLTILIGIPLGALGVRNLARNLRKIQTID